MAIATTMSMRAPSGLGVSSVNTRNGNNYIVDGNGYLPAVFFYDVSDLLNAGFVPAPLEVDRTNQLACKIIGANFNVTTDQVMPLSLAGLAPFGTKMYIDKIIVTNASVSLTTAAGGFYTAASKGGTAVVATGQAYSALTAANIAIELAIAARLDQTTNPALFFSLTTAQGAPATADIYVFASLLG